MRTDSFLVIYVFTLDEFHRTSSSSSIFSFPLNALRLCQICSETKNKLNNAPYSFISPFYRSICLSSFLLSSFFLSSVILSSSSLALSLSLAHTYLIDNVGHVGLVEHEHDLGPRLARLGRLRFRQHLLVEAIVDALCRMRNKICKLDM